MKVQCNLYVGPNTYLNLYLNTAILFICIWIGCHKRTWICSWYL